MTLLDKNTVKTDNISDDGSGSTTLLSNLTVDNNGVKITAGSVIEWGRGFSTYNGDGYLDFYTSGDVELLRLDANPQQVVVLNSDLKLSNTSGALLNVNQFKTDSSRNWTSFDFAGSGQRHRWRDPNGNDIFTVHGETTASPQVRIHSGAKYGMEFMDASSGNSRRIQMQNGNGAVVDLYNHNGELTAKDDAGNYTTLS